MKKNMFVVTHKKIDNIIPKERSILLVGACNKDKIDEYFVDSNGDNISHKNKNFCELTGLYWMTKNCETDVLGLEHYRRFFISRKFFFFKFPFLTDKKVEKILNKYDVIVPKKSLWEDTIYNEYGKGHVLSDLDEVKNIIENKCPEYLSAFNEVVVKGHYAYMLNMFIGKKEVIEKYANWLFSILFELENKIDISNRDAYQSRVYGFLSERLFAVFLAKNSEIKICEKPVQLIESNSASKCQILKIKRKLARIFKKEV